MEKIVVGLGNPGSRYEKSRHNAGWMVLDRLAERSGSVGRTRARDGAASVRGRLEDMDLLLVKPTTYMNLSGPAVRKVLAREGVALPDLLVVVDDLALTFGRLRMRERGSDGGHNGLRSIIDEMGTQAFARLRVGIGRPARGAVEHVLGDFSATERDRLDEVIDAAADCVMDWAHHGPARAADRWNGWKPVPDRPVAGTASPPSEPAVAAPTTEPPTTEPPTTEPPVPGTDGIVRTRTGWRRILPSGRGKPGSETRP